MGIGGDIGLQVDLGQRLVASDDLGGVIQHQLAARVAEALLHGRTDQAFVHRKHDDLVIGEQAILHRPTKTTVEKRFAKQGGVVHRCQFGTNLVRLAANIVAEDPGRGGHVEALAGLHIVIAVDLDEI